MNLPNRLTVSRIILVPVFMVLLLWDFPFHHFAALLIFIIASLTDMLDGNLARRNNQITNFGKFLDPIADKMLTTAAFLGFIVLKIGYGMVWMALIVLIREFVVSSIRMITASKGTVIAADGWGKAKTICQMTAIIMAITFEGVIDILARYAPDFTALNTPFVITYNIFLWASTALALISGVNYIVKNRKHVDHNK